VMLIVVEHRRIPVRDGGDLVHLLRSRLAVSVLAIGATRTHAERECVGQ
jgi:hypothetical protein